MIASRICPLIDWFQAVYNDCTIEEVFSSIGVNYLITDDVEKVLAERFWVSEGFLTSLVFNFNGIIVKVRGYDLQKLLFDHDIINADELDTSVFSWVFPYVNITLSGSTLDFLRQSGIDVNTILFQPLLLPEGASYHVTRVDFAFDLVNYMPNFLDDCLDQVKRSTLPSGRLMSTGQGGMCYTVRTGNKEKTLYLGSTKSNKLLRIYDKNLQFQFKPSSNPYAEGDELPSSWIRVELQLRREQECHKLLYGCQGDMMKVLRYVYENFALVESDGSKYGQERHVSECWMMLFDWEQIGRIVQNANCVQVDDLLVRNFRFIKNIAFSNIAVFVAFYGWDSLISVVNNQFSELQFSNDELDQRRFNALMSKILSVTGDLPVYCKKNEKGGFELL